MNERNQLARLKRAVIEDIDDIDFDVILPQLDAYAVAQLAGEPYTEQFADIALMLDQSAVLSSIYARVYDAAAQNDTADLSIPAPNLDFLTPRPSLAQLLHEAIRVNGNKIRFALSDALLPLLAPPPTPALVLRGAADRQRYNKELLKLEQEEGRPFTLVAWQDSENDALCLVEVTVEPPGKMWPDLAGSSVCVTAAGNTYTETTDEWGLAAFEDIVVATLGALSIEIEIETRDRDER